MNKFLCILSMLYISGCADVSYYKLRTIPNTSENLAAFRQCMNVSRPENMEPCLESIPGTVVVIEKHTIINVVEKAKHREDEYPSFKKETQIETTATDKSRRICLGPYIGINKNCKQLDLYEFKDADGYNWKVSIQACEQ